MNITFPLGAAVAGLLAATSAYGETTATAWTDLNLRAGPGTTYAITSVIPAAETVSVEGCLDASNWCRVNHGGIDGWASGDYLTAMVDNAEVPIYANRERVQIATVTYEDSGETAALTGASGALAGALVGGPVGALVGAVVGIGAGAMAAPDDRVVTYVRTNPVEPLYLDGEIVVGAGIPETVTLAEVPDSDYYYTNINGVPVIVQREDRRVIHIIR